RERENVLVHRDLPVRLRELQHVNRAGIRDDAAIELLLLEVAKVENRAIDLGLRGGRTGLPKGLVEENDGTLDTRRDADDAIAHHEATDSSREAVHTDRRPEVVLKRVGPPGRTVEARHRAIFAALVNGVDVATGLVRHHEGR